MSIITSNINAILAQAPIIAANAAANINSITWGGQYTAGLSFPAANVDLAPSGLYAGSLSSQGNMVAMQLSTGIPKYIDTTTGLEVTPSNVFVTTGNIYTATFNNRNIRNIVYAPYMSGYFRQYWTDPLACTFGADSPMPALTGVMPARFTDMQGSFVYYVDLQLQRLSGSNIWDNYYFINAFNQCLSWVLTANEYSAGLLKSEETNLKYYGFESYDDLITQGFNKYKASEALTVAFSNLGSLVQYIPEGHFGTPNQVAKAMIDFGLGAISDFSDKLLAAGIVFEDIYNPNYTARIIEILRSVNDQNDLETIQEVFNSTVPNITTLLDYTSIERASGLVNDSGFLNLTEVGKDLYLKAPGFNFILGTQVAQLIRDIQVETSPSIEELKTNDSLLTPEIISALRQYLPLTANNAPVSILNVIGTASGYYTEQLELINEGIAELLATDYGARIRQLFIDISRYHARIPFNDQDLRAAEAFIPVPPPIFTTQTINGQTTEIIVSKGGLDYWDTNRDRKILEYYALLDELVADQTGNIPFIVQKINGNYDYVCELLRTEFINYNKANLTVSTYSDNSILFGFVSSMPEYGIDLNNVGTDFLLYGICQPTTSGNIAQTLLGQGKNNFALANAGVTITGVV
jgi:hypothetical protein